MVNQAVFRRLYIFDVEVTGITYTSPSDTSTRYRPPNSQVQLARTSACTPLTTRGPPYSTTFHRVTNQNGFRRSAIASVSGIVDSSTSSQSVPPSGSVPAT